ncbi:alpha/beta hydrolase family protein [Streptomyces inusitatus]|uniref:alpha/beta hydrolase family protein n=1 Tax=Streptomyces inusitatus TaxID=68221 RepID=UPI0027E3E588|nr:prolyl oligopeptidase family serine peptidase [Streptomyces inusitatus]
MHFIASGLVEEDPYRRTVCRVGLDGSGFARVTDDRFDHVVTVPDGQVHPDHTLRLADRLIAADKDFELLIVPGAEHTFIDCLAHVRKRCWDFLVRELMGAR